FPRTRKRKFKREHFKCELKWNGDRRRARWRRVSLAARRRRCDFPSNTLMMRKQNRANAALSALLTLIFHVEILGSGATPRRSAELVASSEPGWPQFRGARRDGRSDERGLLQSWPKDGPARLWSAGGLGRGFSSPIIAKDKIYLTGDAEGQLHLFALDLDGRQAWRTESGVFWKTPYPGARATPTYSDGRLYLQNAHGEIRSFDAETGKLQWTVDLLE